MARVVTGKDDASEAVEAIRADPAVLMQFRQAMANIEADGLPYNKMFPLTDANSVQGTITFLSPSTGDFTVIGGIN